MSFAGVGLGVFVGNLAIYILDEGDFTWRMVIKAVAAALIAMALVVLWNRRSARRAGGS